MRKLFITLTLLWLSTGSFCQTIAAGEYEFGLNLAYDSNSKKLTGYFENYSGWDDKTDNSKFSCVFYIQGTYTDSIFNIETYYPNDKENTIIGQFQIINPSTIGIKLTEEHGGCWNVQHFADEQIKLKLEKPIAWNQIRYISANKAYFYLNRLLDTKQKAYLLKNDLVCIHQIEDDWAYCTFYGNTTTNGWLRTADLNKL